MTALLTLARRLALAGLAAGALALPAFAAEDYSPAERALFMTNHLASTKPPTTLRYSYTPAG